MESFRRKQLDEAVLSRILILDGAMGTMLQAYNPTAADFGGAGLENCNENLCRTHPEWIVEIHRAYIEAGADILTTNSFQASPIVLEEFGLKDQAHALNVLAAQLARQAAGDHFVAGSMGPTTKSLTLRGDVSFDQLRASYQIQARALVEGGVDLLLIETGFDTRNVKAALLAIQDLNVPVIISGTIERWGAMLAGQSVDAFYASVAHVRPFAIGLNCATGPDLMTDHIRTLAQMSALPVSCFPNAGLPNEDNQYLETPESLTAQLEKFVNQGWLNIVGGCCGTTPAHIRAIAQMAAGRPPRTIPAPPHRSYYSGVDLVEAEESLRPLIVGERTNVIGSRLFKNLIAEEKWEEATEIARWQVKNGAHVIDVCLQSSEREELKDIDPFYGMLMPKIKAPVMIDTTDPRAIESALKWTQGKSIINSINLEDGEEKFERVCPLARAYGAALVVGTIDEDKQQAQAFTRERKLAVAQRSVRLLTEKYGFAPEDVIIDTLVFPCATGDENYIGGAVETIEAIRLIKQQIPYIKTILGVSNISFGLPAAAREVVNSVFLYHATKAGLDLAIVNAERLERFASIPMADRRLAENLLFNTPPADAIDPLFRTAAEDWREQSRQQKIGINQFHISAITERFRKTVPRDKKAPDAPLDQRLARYIIEGTKDGLIPDLDLKRQEGAAPLDIINGPLMAGMTEVGRLFNNNELIVAEVLQSAEAMKAAVNHLQQFMEKADTATRGTIVLATVKGDVHDIGKNLVEIILANNGYQVINLGIKVPSDDLIRAWREHRPDAIGLSGLLVKSAHQMVTTAQDFKDQGVAVPLLVGGAALSEKFATTRIGPAYGAPIFYAKDAMTGLGIMNQLMDPAQRDAALASHLFTAAIAVAPESTPMAPAGVERSPKVRIDIPIPPVPYLDRRVREIANLREIWSYVNPFMLYGRHLGFKGNFEKLLAERDPTAMKLYNDMEQVKLEAAEFMKVRAVWQFFEAERDGNAIRLFIPGLDHPAHAFHFVRQPKGDQLCLSDYILPGRDHLALFVVTAGEGIRQRSEEAKAAGRFFFAHALQALALESAEACAEWLHRRIREDWGFPDAPTLAMRERFVSHYRGKRYSFGYPACPNLEDQKGLFDLLKPEDIGVQLTEGFMMDPEASVSALAFHHPDCSYFSVNIS